MSYTRSALCARLRAFCVVAFGGPPAFAHWLLQFFSCVAGEGEAAYNTAADHALALQTSQLHQLHQLAVSMGVGMQARTPDAIIARTAAIIKACWLQLFMNMHSASCSLEHVMYCRRYVYDLGLSLLLYLLVLGFLSTSSLKQTMQNSNHDILTDSLSSCFVGLETRLAVSTCQ